MSKVSNSSPISRFREWLASESTPRWILILSGLIVLLAPMGFEYWKDQQAIGRQRLDDAINSFELGALDIQGFAGTYVTAILDNTNDVEEKRDQLAQMISRQHGAVDLADRLFDDQTAMTADEYQSALTQLQEILPQINQVLDMGPFWEANARVLIARDKFLSELRSQES